MKYFIYCTADVKSSKLWSCSYKHNCVHNCEDHSLLNYNFVCNLFVSLYFSLVWSHSCESKLHSGNNMILTSLIRYSDCCQCKYTEWRSCRRSAHDQTGCWPARSEATCIHSGYADCSLQSRQFLRGREGYILTILRWQLLLLVMCFFHRFCRCLCSTNRFSYCSGSRYAKGTVRQLKRRTCCVLDFWPQGDHMSV